MPEVMTTPTLVTFEKEDFPLLAMSEKLMPGRGYVGVDELISDLGDESQGLIGLCQFAGGDLATIDKDNLLYIECDEDAVLTRVYPPGVWAQKLVDDSGAELGLGLVLAVGQNQFQVEQTDNGKFKCGRLTGGFNSEIKEINGDYYLISQVIWDDEEESFVFYTNLRIDGKAHPITTRQEAELLRKQIAKSLEKKQPIAPLLMKLGEGTGNTINMQQLGLGEFLIEKVTVLSLLDDKGKPKTSYTLTLAIGETVWARGGVAITLSDSKQKLRNALAAKNAITIKPGNGEKVLEEWDVKAPLTLVVSDIKETAPNSGKYSVACKLVLRAPAIEGTPMQAALAPAKDGAEQEAIPF